VAQGSAELALSFGTQLWDVAAPALIVTEAGGHFTDGYGTPSLLTGSLVTSNGHFAEVLRMPSLSPEIDPTPAG
jgi:histidinol-phosphatase